MPDMPDVIVVENADELRRWRDTSTGTVHKTVVTWGGSIWRDTYCGISVKTGDCTQEVDVPDDPAPATCLECLAKSELHTLAVV